MKHPTPKSKRQPNELVSFIGITALVFLACSVIKLIVYFAHG